MAILVIGNGFDLAHGLPTEYADFLEFLKMYVDDEEIESAGKRYPEIANFVNRIKDLDGIHNTEVHDLLGHMNCLLAHFHDIREQNMLENKKGWVDFESEIARIILLFEQARKEEQSGEKYLSLDVKNQIVPFICSSNGEVISPDSILVIPKFFESMSNYRLDDLNRITRLLEIYLSEFVDRLENIDAKPQIANLPNITHVLSFNYTHTYQKLYGQPNTKYCYIHGEANESSSVDTCNLVLGINEYLKGEEQDNDNAFICFKKFYQRIYKETSSEYIDWLDKHDEFNSVLQKQKPDILDIYFYGHSLDVTDKDVIERLILHNNSRIHIFYRNKVSMAKQIQNLVKIIGEQNLIRLTRGSNRTIFFERIKSV